ncbi:Putative protein [Zobellia galactanivorans]|uniref:Uncharacterized protein n=1 Tax=Zobellia galactanivorans (strain DSM 12802 / CCUG 47099 / CIP 106680 / NCIMB 13871 / Dsij) TaxID=63186 RepID=G0L6X7_ZOBGA|nr:Putative protein [Zobellia galactanivorans]
MGQNVKNFNKQENHKFYLKANVYLANALEKDRPTPRTQIMLQSLG